MAISCALGPIPARRMGNPAGATNDSTIARSLDQGKRLFEKAKSVNAISTCGVLDSVAAAPNVPPICYPFPFGGEGI